MHRSTLFFIYMTCFAMAQAATVNQISIHGNDKTQDSIILREIHHPIPSQYNPSLAEEDRNRIYNLGIFSSVDISQKDSSYVIYVIEGLRWIPFPIIDYDEAKGKDGWSYGMGMRLLNFRGINETINLGFSFGDVNNYFLNLHDPWIAGNHISFGFTTFDQTNAHAVYPFRLTQQDVSVNTGFYIREVHKFVAYTGYDHRTVKWESNLDELETLQSDKSFDHLFFGFMYDFDTRDIYIDPRKGNRIGFEVSQNVGISKSIDFNSVAIWINKWVLLNNRSAEPVLSFKTKAFFQFSDKLPIFRRMYLGGEDFVRGYSPVPLDNPTDVQNWMESQNIIYQNLSYQQTLFPRTDFNGMELGIDWHVFLDWGAGSESLADFRLDHCIYGYGAGLIFYASGLGSITVDFGYNPFESDTHMHLSDSN